jgi:uncharacterized membrane protein YfhO
LTLMGVLVPPGTATFALVYWPASVQLGLGVSGTTILALVLFVGWLGWAQRRIEP